MGLLGSGLRVLGQTLWKVDLLGPTRPRTLRTSWTRQDCTDGKSCANARPLDERCDGIACQLPVVDDRQNPTLQNVAFCDPSLSDLDARTRKGS